MQLSSKLLFRTAIVLVGVMLAMVVFVAINSQQAKAIDSTDWEIVRGYINSYYSGSQSGGGPNGEAGFRMGKLDLWNRLDSNGDIQPNAGIGGVGTGYPSGVTVTGVADEGDDMVNRPVLIDNLMGQSNYIPGTEFRCNWGEDGSCFSSTSIAAIRQIVDNHQDAGFSTDIVDHCVSSQTAGPSTGGFGIIAQVPGALATDTGLTPNVYISDYSRNGWRNNVSNAPGTNPTTAPEAATGVPNTPPAPAGTSSCTLGAGTELDLVLCQANWAIAKTLGNVGNGQGTISTIDAAAQSVDVRSGSINTMASAGVNMQVQIDDLFSIAGLQNLDPTKTTVLAARTQMGSTGGIGLKMLDYNMIAGAAIKGGMPTWESTEGEMQVAYGPGLPLQYTASFTSAGAVDTTGPSVSSVGHTNVTGSSADIERTAGEPATMKVKYGTTSGVYTNEVNNTVLNAIKDAAPGNGDAVQLTGLTDSTTYYYEVTSYDGYANGTVSAEGSFTTLNTALPIIDSLVPAVGSWTNDNTPTVTINYHASGTIDSASLLIDGTPCAGATWDQTNITCTAPTLTDGAHTISGNIGVGGNVTAANPGAGTFGVETTAPVVSNLQSSVVGTSVTLTAVLADSGGSGVNATSAAMYVDGSITPLDGCTKTTTSISCAFTSVPGDHSFTASVSDNAGNESAGVTPAEYTVSDYQIIGAIGVKWNGLSGAPGNPLGQEYAVMNGEVWLGQAQDFSDGRIFWSPGGGCYWIHGAILVKYNALGGASGFLGVPLSDEYAVAGGRGGNFAGGVIYWSIGSSAHAVNGAILTKLLSDGGVAQDGFPMSDEYGVATSARASDFQRARIYWSAGTGAHTVFGAIMTSYVALGGPTSVLGLPISDEYNTPGVINGRQSDFAGGSIYYHPLSGVTQVYGGIYNKYVASGGPTGFLGRPTVSEMDVSGVTGAREAGFLNGRIYWSPTTGAHTINGGILNTYLAFGGPTSALGLPTSDEYSLTIPGARRSVFEHGFVTFVPGVGAWVDII